MAHGTVQFQTDNIFIQAPKANIREQLTVEGNAIYFKNSVLFYQDTSTGRPPRLATYNRSNTGHEVLIDCYSDSFLYDTFWLCENPLLNLYITFYHGNHIVQFEVMTQEELDTEPGDGFGFELTFVDIDLTKININKPFNFEPGKKYMIIFQQEYIMNPVNIFWTELTDYAN